MTCEDYRDCDLLRREIELLRGDCDTLRRDRAAAEAAVRRLESDNAFGIEQRNVAEAEVRRLWNENDALRKMVVTSPRLHEDLDALKRANEQLGAELRDLRQKLPTERVPTKQPPSGGHGDVWADIIAKLLAYHPMRAKCIARRELGLARYGQPLRYGTGRPEDCEEELLDAAGYAWRDGWPWALVLHLLDVAAGPDSVRKLVLDIPVLRTRVQDLEVGLDTLRGWLARDRDLLTSATWCLASLVTSGDSAPAKDLLAARELMDEIHRTLTRRAGGER